MSPIADMSAHPSAFGVVTRIPKRERPRKHARIAVKLDTVMGVAREMGRLIRLSYNGHLPPEELTRYIFALDKLRACLESAIAIDAAAPAGPSPPLVVNVVAVPEGYSVQGDGTFRPMPFDAPRLAYTPAPEPRSSREERLLDELISLTDEQLRQRAIQCGLDPNSLSSSSSTNAD